MSTDNISARLGDYNDSGFVNGVASGARKFTALADPGKPLGTFNSTLVPEGAYLRSGLVVVQRGPGISPDGMTINIKYFGSTEEEVFDAFSYPNVFEVIRQDNELWEEYDAYYSDLFIIGPDKDLQEEEYSIVEHWGYYEFDLNHYIPESMEVRWYTEGGHFESTRNVTRQTFGITLSESRFLEHNDSNVAHIYCEVEGIFGQKTVRHTIYLEGDFISKDDDPTAEVDFIIQYPFEVLDADKNDKFTLVPVGLLSDSQQRLKWTIQSVEKEVIRYSVGVHPVVIDLDELVDPHAAVPEVGSISDVIMTLSGVAGSCGQTSVSHMKRMRKHYIAPPIMEVPPIAVISSTIDLNNIPLEADSFDLSADKSILTKGVDYQFTWFIKSTEKPAGITISGGNEVKDIIVNISDIVDVTAYDPVEFTIDLEIQSLKTPLYYDDEVKTGSIIRPAKPEEDVIAKITSEPVSLENLDPTTTPQIVLKSDTSVKDERFTYDYLWTISSPDMSAPKTFTTESVTVRAEDIIFKGGYDTISVNIQLKMTSKNDKKKTSTANTIATFTRKAEPAPQARIKFKGNMVGDTEINIAEEHVTASADQSVLAPGITYDYAWEVVSAETGKTITGDLRDLKVILNQIADDEGIGDIDVPFKLTVTSHRTPSLTSTVTQELTIKRQAELDRIKAKITADQDLHSVLDALKIDTIHFSSATSTLDPRAEYDYAWTFEGTSATRTSTEKNPRLTLAEVINKDSYDEESVHVTLKITSKEHPSITNTATQLIHFRCLVEKAPVARITSNVDLREGIYTDTASFNLSAETSTLSSGIGYTFEWKVICEGRTKNLNGRDVAVNVAEIIGQPPVGKPFTVELTVTSQRTPTLKSTTTVQGQVKNRAPIDWTPVFANVTTDRSPVSYVYFPPVICNANPCIVFDVYIPASNPIKGTFHVVHGEGSTLNLKASGTSASLNFNAEHYTCKVNNVEFTTGQALTAGTTSRVAMQPKVGVTGFTSLSNIGFHGNNVGYRFTGQISNVKIYGAHNSDDRTYTLIESSVNEPPKDLDLPNTSISRGDTSGSIVGDAVPAWQPHIPYTGVEIEEPIPVPVGAPATFVAGMADGYASRSTDGGATWSAIPRGLGSGSTQHIYGMASSGKTFVAGLSDGTAFRSTDAGASWQEIEHINLNSGAPEGTGIFKIASSGSVFVVGFYDGYASISKDKGVTWTALPRGLNCGNESRNIRALTSLGGVFLAGMTDGYASISKDKGVTWTALPRGLGQPTISWDLTSFFMDKDFYLACFERGFVSKSEDGGITWQVFPKNLGVWDSNTYRAAYVFAGNPSKKILAGMGNTRVIESTDRGRTWKAYTGELNLSAYGTSIYAMADSKDTFVLGPLSYNTSTRSTDGGSTWSGLPDGLGTGCPRDTSLRVFVAYTPPKDYKVKDLGQGKYIRRGMTSADNPPISIDIDFIVPASGSNDFLLNFDDTKIIQIAAKHVDKNTRALVNDNDIEINDAETGLPLQEVPVDTLVRARLSKVDVAKKWITIGSKDAEASQHDITFVGVNQLYSDGSATYSQFFIEKGKESDFKINDTKLTLVGEPEWEDATNYNDILDEYVPLELQHTPIRPFTVVAVPYQLSNGNKGAIKAIVGNTYSERSFEQGTTYQPQIQLARSVAISPSSILVTGQSGTAGITFDRLEPAKGSWKSLNSTTITGVENKSMYGTVFIAPHTFIVVGRDGCAGKSIDHGKTWTPLPQGLGATTPQHIWKVNHLDGVILASGSSGFCSKSEDNGTTWTNLTTNSSVNFSLSVMISKQKYYLFHGGSSEYIKTEDSGSTWATGTLGSSFVTGDTVIGSVYIPKYSKILLATKTGQLISSSDDGATWTRDNIISDDVKNYTFLNLEVTGDVVYAAPSYSGSESRSAHIRKSTDGGTTWQSVRDTIPKNLTISYLEECYALGVYEPPPEEGKQYILRDFTRNNSYIKRSNLINDKVKVIDVDLIVHDSSGERALFTFGDGLNVTTKKVDDNWVLHNEGDLELLNPDTVVDEVIQPYTQDAVLTKDQLTRIRVVVPSSADEIQIGADFAKTLSSGGISFVGITLTYETEGTGEDAGKLVPKHTSSKVFTEQGTGIGFEFTDPTIVNVGLVLWKLVSDTEKPIVEGYAPKYAELPVRVSSIFVVGMEGGYASISTDKGQTWSGLPRGLNSGSSSSAIRAIASSGDTFIAGTWDGYASISTDRGANWTPLTKGLDSGSTSSHIRAIASSGNTFVAGMYDGYASISNDKGVTWSGLPRGLNSGSSSSFPDIYSIASSGDTFIAGMSSGYASISNDKGVTWKALPRGLNSGGTPSTIYAIASSGDTFVAGMEDGYASISNDKGKTWVKLPRGLNSGSSPSFPDIYSIASSGNTFVAGTYDGYASISNDKGKTWVKLPRYLGRYSGDSLLSMASSGDVFVAGMGSGYASISNDKGKTWTALTKGLNSGSTSSHIRAIAVYTPPKNFKTLNLSEKGKHILKTQLDTDGTKVIGFDFIATASTEAKRETLFSFGNGKDVDITIPAKVGDAESTVTITNTGNVTFIDESDSPITSFKTGELIKVRLWVPSGSTEVKFGSNHANTKGFSGEVVGINVLYPSDRSTLNKMFVEKGKEADFSIADPTITLIGSPKWKDSEFNGVLEGYEGTIPSPVPTGIFVVAVEGKVIRSADSGETWDSSAPAGLNSGSTTERVVAMASHGKTIIAGFEGGFCSVSRDAGLTWMGATKGFGGVPSEVRIRGLAYNGTNIVAVFNNGYASLSKDLGQTWTPLPNGLNSGSTTGHFQAIVSVGDTFVAGNGFNSGARSVDGGVTWTKTSNKLGYVGGTYENTQLYSLHSVDAEGNIFLAGLERSMTRSTDKGYSWSQVTGTTNRVAYCFTSQGNIIFSAGGHSSAISPSSISKDKGVNWTRLDDYRLGWGYGEVAERFRYAASLKNGTFIVYVGNKRFSINNEFARDGGWRKMPEGLGQPLDNFTCGGIVACEL